MLVFWMDHFSQQFLNVNLSQPSSIVIWPNWRLNQLIWPVLTQPILHNVFCTKELKYNWLSFVLNNKKRLNQSKVSAADSWQICTFYKPHQPFIVTVFVFLGLEMHLYTSILAARLLFGILIVYYTWPWLWEWGTPSFMLFCWLDSQIHNSFHIRFVYDVKFKGNVIKCLFIHTAIWVITFLHCFFENTGLEALHSFAFMAT